MLQIILEVKRVFYSVGICFNVFSYVAVLAEKRGRAYSIRAEYRVLGTRLTTAEHRAHHLPEPKGCDMCYATGAG